MGKRRRIKGDSKMMDTGYEPRGPVVGPMLVTRAVNSQQAKCGLAWCDQRRIGWSAHGPDMRTVVSSDSDVLYIEFPKSSLSCVSLPPIATVCGRQFRRVYDRFYLPFRASAVEIGSIFDALAPDYETECICDTAFNQRVYLGLLEAVFGRIEPAPSNNGSLRILDYGCGTGLISVAARQWHPSLDLKLFGVDLSKKMVERSQSRGINAAWTSDARIPFPNGFFDAVICAFVTYFFPDSEPFREIHRVLRPGGAVGFNEFKPCKSWQQAKQRELQYVGFNQPDFKSLTVSSPHLTRRVEIATASKQFDPVPSIG